MAGGSPASASDLIQRLDSKTNIMNESNPLYWYYHLKNLGKRAQTQQMVDDVVKRFTVADHYYAILETVAKKYLTYEICEIAVKNNGRNLKYVPNQHRDVSMCLTAVANDGSALAAVPERILLSDTGYEICRTAVSNDLDGQTLALVPKCYLKGEAGRELCRAALRTNGHALKHIPKRLMTKELAKLAIEAPLPPDTILNYDGSYVTLDSSGFSHPVLRMIPKRCLSKDLVAQSIRLNPENLAYAPAEYVSRDLCFELIERDPMNLRHIPAPDQELIDYALQLSPQAILAVPDSLLTIQLCQDALRKEPTIPIEKIPEDIRINLEQECHLNSFIAYESIPLELPTCVHENDCLVANTEMARDHDLSIGNSHIDTIYYITDIHLEHQLADCPRDTAKLSAPEIKRRIDNIISELVMSVSNPHSTLLIGGDVADSVELASLFYDRLSSSPYGWRGQIIAVLGNHELWDGNPMGLKPVRTIDEIIADYRGKLSNRTTLLENELLIAYKGLRYEVLSEQTILDASVKELAEVCANSTFMVLGGIGFSGLNPIYNAKFGLYGATVSTEEDIARTQRFKAVYDKILACAGNLRVIVLTHTQMTNWSNSQYNPQWIYVSGHTHQNTLRLQPDSAAVFSDNQVGYKPTSWHLNSFRIDRRHYDPLKHYPNGIHHITREQYIEFNRCQGITMQGIKHPGDLYALKHNGFYMFVVKNAKGLCLLRGGKPYKLDHDIDYYFEKIPKYINNIRSAFVPYQRALSVISDEVKQIGGSGTVHGCIVDIDELHHLYLNPFDGKITPYFAFNMEEKWVFDNLASLLDSSSIPPQFALGGSMRMRYSTMAKEGQLPVLAREASSGWELATVPQTVLDKSMYAPSNIMRSIQYVFDQGVLRVWNDDILSLDESDDPEALPALPKQLES